MGNKHMIKEKEVIKYDFKGHMIGRRGDKRSSGDHVKWERK
jgi:hypothetical protein